MSNRVHFFDSYDGGGYVQGAFLQWLQTEVFDTAKKADRQSSLKLLTNLAEVKELKSLFWGLKMGF